MPRVKLPRKSTSVDMTAMCDVAFLLLSFFILATKFKPPDKLEVTTPKSVSTKALAAKNVVLVTMDKEGKVYFSIGDENTEEKDEVLELAGTIKGITFTEQEKAAFRRSASFIGVPFAQLKGYLALPPEQADKVKLPGIPVTDTANNELTIWVRAAVTAFQNKTMALLVKGDNDAKFPSFKGVMDAFKKNEQFKFSMITDPEGVPPGTELDKKNQASGGTATDL